MMDGELFADGALDRYLGGRLDRAVEAVAQVPAEEIRFSAESVIDRLIDEYRVVPVEFDFNSITRTPITEKVIRWQDGFSAGELPGQALSVIVPYVGDPELLRRRATTYRMSAPRATIREDAMVFWVSGQRLTSENVMAQIDAMRKEMTDRTSWANGDVQGWEPQLKSAIAKAVRRRKEALDHAAELSAVLDIPLAPAPESQQVHVPVRRKRVRIEPAPPSPGNDDPRLAEDMYQDVIRTISGMSRAAERLPQTARRLGEEGFRDLLLFVLNANYEGAARGEVFNCIGKTDILLGWKDRNVFIGECKMWGGQKRLTEAVDQLLGYTAWRDTKAALIVFIQTERPAEIIEKADAAIRGHPLFRSAARNDDPEVRRDYLMTSKHDPQRYIKMAFLPVVIPNV
ncbi:hypothetical protein [Streptosporangium sp. NPDC020145]|uniref:hypothetical protein n=1 Tax=Streptosporangium sp. NPDC020145 TaxID=3154694 RepID=UPI00342FDE08